MRKLTEFEIKTIDFRNLLTSMNVEGLGEGETKYHFTIELRRISFECDKKFLGICNGSDGTQLGFAIILKECDKTLESVFVTECFESEAFTALGAYAGSVSNYNTLSEIYIRDYTKITI